MSSILDLELSMTMQPQGTTGGGGWVLLVLLVLLWGGMAIFIAFMMHLPQVVKPPIPG